MRQKRIGVFIAVIAVALVSALTLAAASDAATTINYKKWTTKAKIQRDIAKYGLDWSNAPHERVFNANCKGNGRAVRHRGSRKYHTFECYVQTSAPTPENKFYIDVTIVGQRFGEPLWTHGFLCYPEDCNPQPAEPPAPQPPAEPPAPQPPAEPPAPQPPAPSPNCHPSYTGACLDPNASDYDCEGGSGNGPYYTGTVTVIGPDEFGLDADGDGIGCE